jgi:hypothetical protein
MTVPDGNYPPGSYRNAVETGFSPTVFDGTDAAKLIGVLVGLAADLLAERALLATKAKLVASDTVPFDALPRIGDDRQIPRWTNETADAYAIRLRTAWETWQKAATEAGIRGEFERYGLTNIEFFYNSDWNWDGDTANWSRFWPVIHGHPWVASNRVLGDGSLLDGTWTLGSNATSHEVEDIRSIIRRLRPAHVICPAIIVVMDESVWTPTPDGTWNIPTNRNTGAIYW